MRSLQAHVGVSAPVVRWVPGAECRIVVALSSGSLCLLDTSDSSAKAYDVEDAFSTWPQSRASELYEVRNGPAGSSHRAVWRLKTHTAIKALAFSPDTEHVATGDAGGLLAVYATKLVRRRKCIASFNLMARTHT